MEKVTKQLPRISRIGRPEAKGEIGLIENVYEMPAHALAQVMVDSKEVLIPLMEESIVKVDKRKKEVTVNIPEGLMDIYLK